MRVVEALGHGITSGENQAVRRVGYLKKQLREDFGSEKR
jgi:hypothetical protein